MGIATSSPELVANDMLEPVFSNEPKLLGHFDEIFPQNHRCYGDITPFGLSLPVRKPNPLALLSVIRSMELSSGSEIPFSNVVFTDDSCSNCSAAAFLQSWRDNEHIAGYQAALSALVREAIGLTPEPTSVVITPSYRLHREPGWGDWDYKQHKEPWPLGELTRKTFQA